VHQALRRLHGRAVGPPRFLGGRDPDDLELALPHAVYDLGQEALASGRGLEAAVLSGHRHLVLGGGDVLAAAELPAAAGAEAGAAHVTAGPLAQATADAVRAAEALPEVQAGSFEVRLLRVAALHFVALWLAADGPGRALLVPLAPAPRGLTANRAYPAADVLALLRPVASARSGFKYHP
jgi:hypothetical protein